MKVDRQKVIDILQQRIDRAHEFIEMYEMQLVEDGASYELEDAIEDEEFIILMMENIIYEVKKLESV